MTSNENATTPESNWPAINEDFSKPLVKKGEERAELKARSSDEFVCSRSFSVSRCRAMTSLHNSRLLSFSNRPSDSPSSYVSVRTECVPDSTGVDLEQDRVLRVEKNSVKPAQVPGL